MTIEATAMGTSTQSGKLANVNIHIEQFSTADDRKALIDAFAKSGQDGLVSVLEDMKPKGRIRFARASNSSSNCDRRRVADSVSSATAI